MEAPAANTNPDATNPGPIDSSVLYDQEKHVSSAIWEGQERGTLRCHEHTLKLNQWMLTSTQIELVKRAGFGHFRLIPSISLDNLLISALVERWRRETNTFHLSVGEMTVTLTDVALLLGLAIDGEPVIGVTHTRCDSVCERFLGRAPSPGCASGGMVKLCWLKENFSQCPVDAPIEVIKWHTRAYLLYLIGSTIFCSTTGNLVPVMYLPLFEDFDIAGNYAWGAAALAFLYRALGNASLRNQSTISGSLTLLQCWSYSHLNIGRPKPNINQTQDCFPYALRWKGKQIGPTANREVVFYRKALDDLKPCDVEWLPYTDVDSTVIPGSINSSLYLGRSQTMLICFDKAERHLPDRCLRQYEFLQPIPEDVKQWKRKSRGVSGGKDLSKMMESEFNEWSDRKYHIVNHEDSVEESEYMQWYLKITRKFVGRPISLSFEFQRMNSNMRDIANIADTILTEELDEELKNQKITQIRYLALEFLKDHVGGGVAVSTTPQTGLRMRIQGKEKVRRNGMRKRKRISDMTENGQSQFYATNVLVDQDQFGGANSEVDQLCHESAKSIHQVDTNDKKNDEQRLYDADAGDDSTTFVNFSNGANDYQFCVSIDNTSELCNENSNNNTGQTQVNGYQFPDAYINNQHEVALVGDLQLDDVHAIETNLDNASERQGNDIPIGDSEPMDAKSVDSRPSDGVEDVFDTHNVANEIDHLEHSHIVHENERLMSRAYSQEVPKTEDQVEEVFDTQNVVGHVDDLEHCHENATLTSQPYIKEVPQSCVASGPTGAQ